MILNPDTPTSDPDLMELHTRLAEAERDVDKARERCRTLLSTLTDVRITIDAARRALLDYDARDDRRA